MTETDPEETERRYYEKKVFVCRNCGKQWDVPGAAAICYQKDHILELAEEIDAPKHIQLENVIKMMESAIENGEVIDNDDEWWDRD